MKLTKEQKAFEKKFKGKKIWRIDWPADHFPVTMVGWENDVTFIDRLGLYHGIYGREWILHSDIKKWKKERDHRLEVLAFWLNMPVWANWVAVCEDRWEWYQCLPTRYSKGYKISSGYCGDIPEKYKPTWYKGPARDSLMERPK